MLYNLATNCNGNGAIVEIGSWKGKSTVYLGAGSKNGKKNKIYAIDPHIGSYEHQLQDKEMNTFDEFKRNIKNAKVDDIVVPIVKISSEAAEDFNLPVEIIFIDGAHEYEAVKLDFDLWFPRLVDGGMMAFHDTFDWPGPEKVVADMVFKSRFFKDVNFIDTITYARKVEKNSFRDRIRNRYMLFLKNTLKFVRELHLPEPLKIVGRKIFRKVH